MPGSHEEIREGRDPMNNKNMVYFTMGMDRALRIAKNEGIEALEKEVRFRNNSGIHTRLTTKEIDVGLQDIKELTIKTVTTMAVAVLYGEFGFDEKKLQRFLETFEKAAVDLNNGLVTWLDICENIERLTSIRVSLIDDLQKVGGLFDDE